MITNSKKEQIFKLKDGRELFKTHNGFKFWVTDKKGKTSEVTEEYWKQVFNSNKSKIER